MRRLIVPAGGDPALQSLVTDLNGILAEVDGRLNRPAPTKAAALPASAPAGEMRFVPDEAGGPTLAVFDGSDWRRTYDNVVVS